MAIALPQLNGFRCLRRCDRRGCGEWYDAENADGDAGFLLRRVRLADAADRDALLARTAATRDIEHQHVLRLYHVATVADDALDVVTATYDDDRTLGRVFIPRCPLKPREALAITGELAEGLQAVGAAAESIDPTRATLDAENHILVPHPLVALIDEHLEPVAVDADTPTGDVAYDLLALCYRLLTATAWPPTASDQQLTELDARASDLPPRLRSILAHGLAGGPGAGYRDVDDLQLDLAAVLVGTPPPVATTTASDDDLAPTDAAATDPAPAHPPVRRPTTHRRRRTTAVNTHPTRRRSRAALGNPQAAGALSPATAPRPVLVIGGALIALALLASIVGLVIATGTDGNEDATVAWENGQRTPGDTDSPDPVADRGPDEPTPLPDVTSEDRTTTPRSATDHDDASTPPPTEAITTPTGIDAGEQQATSDPATSAGDETPATPGGDDASDDPEATTTEPTSQAAVTDTGQQAPPAEAAAQRQADAAAAAQREAEAARQREAVRQQAAAARSAQLRAQEILAGLLDGSIPDLPADTADTWRPLLRAIAAVRATVREHLIEHATRIVRREPDITLNRMRNRVVAIDARGIHCRMQGMRDGSVPVPWSRFATEQLLALAAILPTAQSAPTRDAIALWRAASGDPATAPEAWRDALVALRTPVEEESDDPAQQP